MIRKFIATMTLLAWVSLCGADERQIEVRLHRKDTVGRKFDVRAAAAVKRKTENFASGREIGSEQKLVGIDWHATAEILAIGKRGDASKIAYTIKKCVQVEADKEQVLIPAGTLVTLTMGEKKTDYEMKGGQLSPDQTEALELVAGLPEPSAKTLDELYGTKQKQKIGASWDVNAEAIADDSKRHDSTFSKDDVSGTTKLIAIEKHDGQEFMRLSIDVKVKNYGFKIPPEWKLPPEMKIKTGQSSTSIKLMIPLDPAGDYGDFAPTQTSHVVLDGKVGKPPEDFMMVLDNQVAVELRARPIKE